MRNLKEAATAALIIGALSLAGCRPADATTTPTLEPIRGRPPATEPAPIFENPTVIPLSPRGTPMPTELSQPTDTQIVQKAITELTIAPNNDEVTLWKQREPIWEQVPPSPNAEASIADLRIKAVLSGMGESKNEHLRNAIGFLGTLTPLDRITIKDNEFVTVSWVNKETKQNMLIVDTAVSRDAVLHTVTKETLIIALVEQAEFHRNLIELMKLFPLLTPEEQFQKAVGLANTSENRVKIGAKRYATGIEAYLLQHALMGQAPTDTDAEYLKHVAVYITFGRNPEDPRWKAYVEKYILSPLKSN